MVQIQYSCSTVATDELLCLKNVAAHISMFFTLNEKSAPMAIETIKILGAILELPPKQHCTANPAHLPQKWAKWANLTVLFS